MRVLLVGNPASRGGAGASSMRDVEALLRREGVHVEARLTERIGHARELAVAAVAEVDAVLACGGDGLVSEIASALAGTSCPMGIIPAGRGNDVARAMGVPLEPHAAARRVLEGRARSMDLGVVGGRIFCTVAACGLDAEVSRRARTHPVALPGPGAYFFHLALALVRFPLTRFRVRADGKLIEGEALVLAIANTPTYGGGFRIAPDASCHDALLDACLLRTTTRAQALALLPRVHAGRHVGDARVEVIRAERFDIEADPPRAIEADGEPIGATPASVTCVRDALRVM